MFTVNRQYYLLQNIRSALVRKPVFRTSIMRSAREGGADHVKAKSGNKSDSPLKLHGKV